MIRSLLCCFMFLSLTACVNLGPKNVQNIDSYAINARLPTAVTVNQQKPLSVLISRGSSLPEFASDKMIYQKGNSGIISAYAYHRWVSAPITMIVSQIAEAVSESHAFKAVVFGSAFDAKVDRRVNIQLVKLQQNVTDQHSNVVLALDVSVINAADSRLLTAQRFKAQVDAPLNAEGMVAATNQALTQLTPKITAFIIASV